MTAFGRTVDNEEDLRALFGPPSKRAVLKQIDRLDDHCRAFIARSPFVLVGTSNTDGTADVSPKGGPAGFVQVLDDRHLAMGELPGNNRLDGYLNIVRTGAIGLLFLIPGIDESMRVNGRAQIVTEPSVLERCAIDGRLPKIALGVEVHEAFIHCAKAMRRSSLWRPQLWPDTSGMPTVACMLATHAQIPDDADGAKTAAALEVAYEQTLWNAPAPTS